MTSAYAIVGTQRSGSNFLCSSMRACADLGSPKEIYNPVHIGTDSAQRESEIDPVGFARTLVSACETRFFGFKIHYLQYFNNFRKNECTLYDAFPDCKIIFLRRVNLVLQAISLWKAEVTQSWTADMEARRGATYNFAEIRKRYFDLKIQDLLWKEHLVALKAGFIPVYYEDVVANFEKNMFLILSYLGAADLISEIGTAKTRMQRDQRSESWENRFRSEYQECATSENVGVWQQRKARWAARTLPEDPGVWAPYKVYGGAGGA